MTRQNPDSRRADGPRDPLHSVPADVRQSIALPKALETVSTSDKFLQQLLANAEIARNIQAHGLQTHPSRGQAQALRGTALYPRLL